MGEIKMSKKHPQIKPGDKFITNEGCTAIVLDYRGALDVIIEFQGEHRHVRSVYADNLRKGAVKNPYHPSVYGFGFIGEGAFRPTKKRKRTPEYIKWSGMLERCYSDRMTKIRPSYSGCFVCPEWHDFQVFSEWITSRKEWGKGDYDLDKDMLIQGNKEYSPAACSLIPRRINAMITGAPRQPNLPYGVTWNKKKGSYIAQCCDGDGVTRHIGSYKDAESAFSAYKSFKEEVVRSAAESYRDMISIDLYDALMRYEAQP